VRPVEDGELDAEDATQLLIGTAQDAWATWQKLSRSFKTT
jgi:hypothetical protein